MKVDFDGSVAGILTDEQVAAATSVSIGANAPDVNTFLFQQLDEVCNRWVAAVFGAKKAQLDQVVASLDKDKQTKLVDFLNDPAKLATITDAPNPIKP